MFQFLGRFAATRPWWICGVWVLLAVGVAVVAPDAGRGTQDDDIRFLPARCPSVRGYQLLKEAFPQDVFASRVLFAVERTDAPLTEADLRLVDAATADLNQLKDKEPALQIGRVVSQREPFLGKRLLSEDGCCTIIQVSLATPYMALQTAAAVDRAEQVVRRRFNAAAADAAKGGATPPLLFVTGNAGVGRDLVRASANGLDSTTLATVLLVVVILLCVYRAPLLALVPLVTIACSVWVALKVLALCTLIPGFTLVNTSQIFAVVMLYGAGTDYCLFLISRYREELAAGRPGDAALAHSVATVGGALAASAGTVICGLGLMAFAEFAKVRSGGPAIAVSLAVALAASLTLAPALLRILGPAVFWPVGVPELVNAARPRPLPVGLAQQPGDGPSRDDFRRVRRPAAAAGDPRLPGAFRLPGHRRAGRRQPERRRPVRRGTALQRRRGRADHRAAGVPEGMGHARRTGGDSPPRPVDPESQERRRRRRQRRRGAELDAAARRTARRPAARPERGQGRIPGVAHQQRQADLRRPDEEGRPRRVPGAPGRRARHVARLDVVLKSDPFDPKSNDTLDLIERTIQLDLPGSAAAFGKVRAETYGVTVGARDLADVTESDRMRINAMVLAGVFLILMVLVRRPWLAAYLLATVLLSYYATLGATTLAATCLHGRPLGEVDWRVPFFLFTILVAVGEDYNILLITRTLQEKKRHGADEGTRRALRHTGGAITSCGLIMAGTFATLMLAGLNTLVQIGFALAFGVLLDTFVVRPFLVPAFTLLVWRREEAKAAAAVVPKKPALFRRAG